MIKIALKNIKFLEIISKIPVLKYFFILKVSENFPKISSEPILQKFYTDIYVSNLTSKKTQKNRFTDLDKKILEIIKNKKKLIIHDVAVSNGISSAELQNLLQKNKIKHEFYISDKYAEVSVKKGFITKVYNNDNHLLFAYVGCFFAGDKNIFFPLTVLLYKFLRKQKLNGTYDYQLLLFHPEILQKINNKEINRINYDIFQTEINEKFTFVRAMNILNLGYFTEKKIKKGIVNIAKSIKENGILLVGRTNEKGINNASIFMKQNEKLILLKDFNRGSEIKHMIKSI